MKIELFLDSGAFSLYTEQLKKEGKRIGQFLDDYSFYDSKEFADIVQAYASYIKGNRNFLITYANMDVLNHPERTADVQRHYEKDHHLTPLPVIQPDKYGRWDKTILDHYQHVGVGLPCLPILDDIFRHVGPEHRVHGFGFGSEKFIRPYGWTSVDNDVWIKTSRFGKIPTPDWKTQTTRMISDFLVRDVLNILPFINLEEETGKKIYLGSWPTDITQALALNKVGYVHRLLSFWELRNIKDPDFLQTYTEYGFATDGPFS